MIYIMLILGFYVSLLLWILVKYAKKSKFLILLIPISFVMIFVLHSLANRLMGYPTTDVPKGKVAFINYYVDNREEFIYYWILEKNDNEPRVIKRIYKRTEHEAAEEAAKASKDGMPVIIEFDVDETNKEKSSVQSSGNNTEGANIKYDFGTLNQIPNRK